MTRLRLALLCAFCWGAAAGLARADDDVAEVTFADLNRVLGIPLWADEQLFDDLPETVARRLGWPREAKTAEFASFRLYPPANARILGCRPYSLALYGVDDQVARLSLVFVNKGDYLYANGEFRAARVRNEREARRLADQILEGFNERIEADSQTMEERLEALLGKPLRTRFGQGEEMSERVDRWDWQGHSLLLVGSEDEYVALRIMPEEVADNNGRPRQRVSDADLREALKRRVHRRPNGDVIITGIPMVDQGPKGYCVPATWERYLWYMGIPADMYLLAVAGETYFGGGTYSDELADGVERYVRRHGRRLYHSGKRPTIRTVADEIDKGLPLMWSMVVYPKLHQELTARQFDRSRMKSIDEWKESLAKREVDVDELPTRGAGGHMCMIIGYNRETREICISDSWGPQFAERWLTEDEAEAISKGRLDYIRW